MANRDMILKDLRDQLDALDDRILSLFSERYRIRDRVMELKIDHDMPIVAPDRVKAILTRLEAQAKDLKIPPEFARALYTLVLDYSHKYEEEFRSRKAS
jgi:chorismate mutase